MEKKILDLAKKNEDYTASILSKIVKVKSLSQQEKDVVEVIKKLMLDAGFDEVKIDGIGNVIGRIGNGKKILAFDGHIDTVDVGNIKNWKSDPFSGEIKDGFVHGRGTADQKGGVAAFITAGKMLKELNFKEDLTIYFVGSVIEEDCDGLCWNYIIQEDKIIPDMVISTESTNCRVYRGQRGRMELNVIFKGLSAHGSAPERGKNAIYMASKVCLEIEKLNEKLKKDDFLGKGSVTISEFISGSPSLCAVADYAKIHLDRRLTLGESKESAVNEIKEIIKDIPDSEVFILNYEAVAYTGLKYGMEKYYPTWVVEKDHFAVKCGVDSFKELYGKEPVVDKWTFSTNGVTIRGVHGIPVIGFGPGLEEMAHTSNEKVPIADLVTCSAVYTMYAYKLADYFKNNKN